MSIHLLQSEPNDEDSASIITVNDKRIRMGCEPTMVYKCK